MNCKEINIKTLLHDKRHFNINHLNHYNQNFKLIGKIDKLFIRGDYENLDLSSVDCKTIHYNDLFNDSINVNNIKNHLTGDKTEYIDTYNKIIKYNLN